MLGLIGYIHRVRSEGNMKPSLVDRLACLASPGFSLIIKINGLACRSYRYILLIVMHMCICICNVHTYVQ